jgi:hypothetical protein
MQSLCAAFIKAGDGDKVHYVIFVVYLFRYNIHIQACYTIP